MNNIYQFSVQNNKQESIELSQYSDKVMLIVNTASRCGFTPQYKGLQHLHDNFHARGFEVLAFPCNQFKQQETGNNEQIQQFCDVHFNIKFPLFNKVEVNGDNAAPLFTYLKQQAPGIFGSKAIKWNFTKFLVNRQGKVVKRYAPSTKPAAITADIERLLRDSK